MEMTPHEMINPTGYVLGFAFSHTMRSVVLIEKLKPDWQAGKLNGVGGKIEPGENAYDAMAREFFEETGWAISYGDWHLFEIMRFRNGAYVYCFTTQLPQGAQVRTMEQEKVETYLVNDFGHMMTRRPYISNLEWLVPKAYHQLKEPASERMIMR